MAPNFALFLSPEGIALAHRQPGGHWAVLGDTALDVPDLGASLLVLRKLAEERAGKEFETLLILPDEQVLYTSLTAPGPDEEDRLDQIRAGLDGLTPYPVADLAFDWFPLEDGRVKLAVVAQETLEEAREFATGHGFAPAGFGARPLDNRFRGVAHFDRSIGWTAEIKDIEFGHDTWHKARHKSALEAEPPIEEAADSPVTEAAPEPISEADSETPASDTASAHSEDRAAPPGDAGTADEKPDPVCEPADKPQTSKAVDAPEGVTGPDGSTDRASGPPFEAGTDTTGQPTTPEIEAPLQVPAGFGSRRKNTEPDAAGALVRDRKSRFGPGVMPPAPAPEDTPHQPALPRDRKPDRKPDTKQKRTEPALGQPERKDTRSDRNAKASAAGGKGNAAGKGPARPQGAGPEPQLPPLARLKSQIATRAPQDRPIPGPNPFAGPPQGADGDRSSLKDRVAGLGRQISESTGKARDAASGLTGRISGSRSAIGSRLRALGRGETDSPPAAATPQLAAAEPEGGTPAPPAITPKSHPRSNKAAKPASAAVAATAGSPSGGIAPPPAETPRRRFSPPKRGRSEPAIADADAPIMGGLLARGSIVSNRGGPTVRTGLILTLILLAVLALVGIWAAFYLPETTLGRWMGLGTPEESIIAEAGPVEPDTPAVTAADAPADLAALTPEAAPPSVSVAAPQAPELLPDIDAAELDLGPALVASPAIDPETVLPSEEENANFYARTGIWQRPPVISLPDPEPVLEEVIFAGLDPSVATHDAFALTEPEFLPSRDRPRPEVDSGVPVPQFVLDPDNMVAPTPEGAMTPYGILVYAGSPPVAAVPRPRDAPEVLAAAAAEAITVAVAEATGTAPDAAADLAATNPDNSGPTPGAVDTALLQAYRPDARPDDLQERRERAVLGGVTLDELALIRPEGRPQSLQEEAAAAAAAEAAATDATDTSPGNVTSGSDLAVAVSFVPRIRPTQIDEIVEQARAAGNSNLDAPGAASASDTMQPDIPSSASVTRAATEENGINLRNLNLIGVSGSSGDRRALVRLPSGRFVTVEVGDRLDGGQVAAIGESSLQYVKRGRTITLDVPTG